MTDALFIQSQQNFTENEIREKFTPNECQLLLKLINLFNKYPEVTWSCGELALRWQCGERSVRRLMAKLRNMNLIKEIRYHWTQCVRKATETLLTMKQKIIQAGRGLAGAWPGLSPVRIDRKSLDPNNVTNHEKTDAYNKDKDKLRGIPDMNPDNDSEPDIQAAVRLAKTIPDYPLNEAETERAIRKHGIKSFGKEVDDLFRDIHYGYKPKSIKALLITKFFK